MTQTSSFPIARFLRAFTAARLWQNQGIACQPMCNDMFFGQLLGIDSAIDASPDRRVSLRWGRNLNGRYDGGGHGKTFGRPIWRARDATAPASSLARRL